MGNSPNRAGRRTGGAAPKPGAFARRLLDEWKRLSLPTEDARAVVAASGGADSTALLLACDELVRARRLRVELVVAHLNHGLRGEAGAADARRVGRLAGELGCEFVVGEARVKERARATRDNLEQAARRERYAFLARVAREWGAGFVLTGHTLDDQAETVLLALLRGSGADGLSGMSPLRRLDTDTAEASQGEVLLARPLLRWARRADTVSYCRERGVEPLADAMNEDETFARVRVRRQLVPLLETFNPRAAEALARTAALLADDAHALEIEAARLLEAASEPSVNEGSASTSSACGACPLLVGVLNEAAPALRRRALRQWLARGRGDLRRLELVHVRAVERLLEGERGGRVIELPGGSSVERRRGRLLFRRPEKS